MKRSGTKVENTEKLYSKLSNIKVENCEISESSCDELRNDDPDLFIEPRTKDKAVQVFFSDDFFGITLLVCNRSKENGICEAETQSNT